MTDTAPKTVLLTGITGFIAKRIARDLLEAGYASKGSLRSLKREEEVRSAVTTPETADRLSLVELDLTSDAGWAEAMAGVDALLHTASPFPLARPKDENDIIGPAVDGTLRALKAAQAAAVTRVVLTSSVVAIMYVDRPKGHAYGPEDWTDTAHPTATAYIKSKTLAEQAAWDFVKTHPEMELTAINPGLVLGAPLDQNYGSSLAVVERILSGSDPAVPDIGFPVVDVADVSRLHVEALAQPASVGKRVVAAGEYMTMPQMAKLLAEAYPKKKIATLVAPKLLLRVLALFDSAVKTILPTVGFHTPTDNTETRAIFGIDFVPAPDAIRAGAEAVLAHKGSA